MLDILFSNPAQFATDWYRWGAAIALALTIVITFYIFFNSARLEQNATFWRVLSLAAALAAVPGAVLSLRPVLVDDLADLSILSAYVGFLGVPIALICFVLYSLGLGVNVHVDDAVEPLEYEPLPPIQRTSPLEPKTTTTGQNSIDSADFVGSAEDAPTRILTADASPPEPLGWLAVMSGALAGKAFRLGALAHVGRDAEQNDIFVADEAMSRQHARVKLEKNNVFVIYDLASANGITVNGERVERQALENGDRIVLGQTTFAFMRVRERASQSNGGEDTLTVEIEPSAG